MDIVVACSTTTLLVVTLYFNARRLALDPLILTVARFGGLVGLWAVPLATAVACATCVDRVNEWFSELARSQPLMLNAGLRPLETVEHRRPFAAQSPSSTRAVPPARDETLWLDAVRFRYVDLCRRITLMARAATPSFLASLTFTGSALLLLGIGMFVLAQGPIQQVGNTIIYAVLLGTTYVYFCVLAGVLAYYSTSVHQAALDRCQELDLTLQHLPLHVIQQVQTLVLRRPAAFSLLGYPLSRTDFARAMVGFVGLVVPAAVRALAT